MALPTKSQIYRPALQVAADTNSSLTLRQFLDELAVRMALTEDDLNERVQSGSLRMTVRTRFALMELRKAGLLKLVENRQFQITRQGRDFLGTHPERIGPAELARLYPKEDDRADTGDYAATGVESDAISPEEQMSESHRQHLEMLAADVLDSLKSLKPADFERSVVDLLSKMGYGDGQVTGKSGDQGIDGILDEDTLGLEKVYIQAKRYDNAQVGEPEIRNFSGSLVAQGATKGVFITTSTFSATARQTAQSISMGNQFIRLVDGRELAALMIKHGVGVVTEITYEVKKLDANYFAEV